MNYTIVGDQLPVLTIHLNPLERIMTENESPHLSWVSPDIKKVTISTSSFPPFFSKLIFGDARVLDVFVNQQKNSVIAFSTSQPSKIVALDVLPGQGLLVKKGCLLAMEQGVKALPASKFNLWDALFGNDDLALINLEGKGKVFIQTDRSATEYQLADGETIAFDQSSIAYISGSIKVKTKRTNIIQAFFFGGNDAVRHTLTGPGKVVMQNANYQR
jgi:uncharacterized protein (AIM24 family)